MLVLKYSRKRGYEFMRYIDLFSGAGGMTLGFERAGFQNVLSVENNIDAIMTYKKNFPRHSIFEDDIKKLSKNYIYENIGAENSIDLVIGGPPCQGFSIAGNIGRGFLADERNYLFKEFVRIVSIILPKVFVMENVARLETHNNGKTLKEICKSFEEIGYVIKHKVLNASDFGIAQERRRIFIVGMKGKNNFIFPTIINKKVSIKEVIGDLPKLESGQECTSVANHIAMKHTQQMLNKMMYVSDGGNRNEIPIEIRPKTGDVRKYIRYNSLKPSVCITGDMRKVFHYNQNRALTARELARIQTFPDDFIFCGTSISIQQQIGNAVPPTLAYAIAKEVERVLNE